MRGIQMNIKYQEALFNTIMRIILFAHFYQANSILRVPLSHGLTLKEEALIPKLHRAEEAGAGKRMILEVEMKYPSSQIPCRNFILTAWGQIVSAYDLLGSSDI